MFRMCASKGWCLIHQCLRPARVQGNGQNLPQASKPSSWASTEAGRSWIRSGWLAFYPPPATRDLWMKTQLGLMFHSSFVWKLSTEPKAWSRVIEALKCQTGRNWMDVGRVGREVCLGSSKVSNIHLWFPMFLCPGCGNLLDGRIKIVTLMALGTNASVLA